MRLLSVRPGALAAVLVSSIGISGIDLNEQPCCICYERGDDAMKRSTGIEEDLGKSSCSLSLN